MLLLLALCAQGVTLWIGYDRLPLLPVVGDGPLIHDAPLSLAAGHGLVSPCFAGTLNFETMYAHHPPVYLLLQALIYRTFGLSPLTMRGLSLVATSLCTGLFLCCFVRLMRMIRTDRLILALTSFLLLVEPMFWYSGRWERMDSLVNVFAAAAFLFLLRAVDAGGRGTAKGGISSAVVLAGVSTGLAVSTSLEGAVPALFLGVFVLVCWRRIGWRNVILFGLLPPLTFGLLWVVVYGGASVTALQQILAIAGHHTGGMMAASASGHHGPTGLLYLLRMAPIAMAISVLAWGFGIVRMLHCPKAPGAENGICPAIDLSLPILLGLTAALFFLFFVAGENPRRFVLVLPFALASIGVFEKGLPSRWRQPLGAVLGLFGACSAAVIIGYLWTVVAQWQTRLPERFDALVASIPLSARVAAVPDFWYAFQVHHRAVRLIDVGFPEDKLVWDRHPEALARYDYVILTKEHPFAGLAGANRDQTDITCGRQQYTVFTSKTAKTDKR